MHREIHSEDWEKSEDWEVNDNDKNKNKGDSKNNQNDKNIKSILRTPTDITKKATTTEAMTVTYRRSWRWAPCCPPPALRGLLDQPGAARDRLPQCWSYLGGGLRGMAGDEGDDEGDDEGGYRE